jgi:Na+/melibiose symporter-like transporter
MIVTRQKHIPLHWILLAITPWAVYGFASGPMGNALLFTLKKFVDDPVALTFILTLPGYISIFLAPLCSFLSDRIWTRFGRRKPFIIVSWLGMLTSLLLMPLMTDLWSLAAVYILFRISVDVGNPLEPLKLEIVPPHQRGMATAAMTWVGNISGLFFYFVALGRFDDVRFMSGHPLSGETLIYWTAVLVLVVTFLVLTLGIKEIDPKSPSVGEKLSFKILFTALLDRDLLPVYALVFGAAMLGAGLGPLGNLLYTDQWNYSKQEMGTNIAIGGLAFIADRLDRMRAYQTFITLSLGVQVFYYIYVEYILPDQRPSLIEIVCFGETLSILGILTQLVYLPLVYDYVVRDKMGTYSAGSGLLSRLTGILTLNAVGLFVSVYALLFQPPAGDMARICLDRQTTAADMRSIIQKNSWTYPTQLPAPASDVQARAWYSTGIVMQSGACWEIRLRDAVAEKLASRIDDWQGKLTPLLAQKKMLQDQAKTYGRQNKREAESALNREAEAKQTAIDNVTHEMEPLQAELKSHGDYFQQQVVSIFGPELLHDGDQIVDARLIANLTVTRKPTPAIEKTLIDLRREDPHVIDLRTLHQGENYSVQVSALLEPGANEEQLADRLAESLTRLANRREAGLFPVPPRLLSPEHRVAVILRLRIVEDPLDDHISPITRVINSILAWFDSAPEPEHRLAATARRLRSPGQTEHVGIEPDSGTSHIISVVALLSPQATSSQVQDVITQRLQGLLGPVPPETVAQVRAFYDRVVDDAALQRITIERPLLDHGNVPIRYDYRSGYIPIFILGLVGLSVTYAFGRWEKKGFIRKRGVEEAESS